MSRIIGTAAKSCFWNSASFDIGDIITLQYCRFNFQNCLLFIAILTILVYNCPQTMGKECFVIPRESLETSGFIPKESEGQFTYTRIANLGELRSLISIANSAGEYRERYGDQGVEEDPTFQ